MKRRILGIVLSLIMILGLLPTYVRAAYENTHINKGNPRVDIVEVAKTQIGYKEGKNDDNKYGAYFNANNQNWCAYFVTWCARQAGIGPDIIKTSGFATADDFGVAYKEKTIDPQPGDIIIFDFAWDGYDNRTPKSSHGDHVGIVEYVKDGKVHTIEGNSGENANCVDRYEYPLDYSEIKGYGVPAYPNQTYTIMFNSNGGSGSMSDQQMIYGISTAIKANTFTRAGYTFAGWNAYRVSDGTWRYRNPNDSNDYIWCKKDAQPAGFVLSTLLDGGKWSKLAQAGDTIRLYAVWTPNIYTLTFNANGGSGSMSDQQVLYGVSTAIKPNTFTRTGYTFAGWNAYRVSDGTWRYRNPDDSNDYVWCKKDTQPAGFVLAKLLDGGKWSKLANSGDTVILYAVWTPIEYNMTLTPSASSVSLDLAGTNTASFTLYVGGSGPSTVLFGVQNMSNPQIASYSKEINGRTITITMTGKQKGSTDIVFRLVNGDTGENLTTCTVMVYVDAPTYTLTYDAQGGTVSPSSKTFTYGEEIGALPTPTRTGYSFNGWYTTSGLQVSPNTVLSGNTTIFAHWTPAICTVSGMVSGSNVQYSVTRLNTFATLLAARYESGKMAEVKTILLTGSGSGDTGLTAKSGSTYKLFLLDSSYVPLCAAWEG